MDKITYRIRNWSEYNRALVNRGNLAVWISSEIEASWFAKTEVGLRKVGRSKTYSDSCIELMLVLRCLFHLPLRATQGFFEGFFRLLKLDLKTPHYSRLSRRAAGLRVCHYSKGGPQKSTDLVIDSTGLKVYGEGEWKVRLHGKSRRRTWRKLHIAVDPRTFETVSIQLTHSGIHDDQMMGRLLEGRKRVGIVYADGAYISKASFDLIAAAGAIAKIPLRTGTGLVKKHPSAGQILRNNLVKEIWAAGGKQKWKKSSGYHQRSLVETQMYRFKTIFGSTLLAKTYENQVNEAKIKTFILNRMTRLGMPISQKIGRIA